MKKYAEKKELLYRTYTECLDLNVAQKRSSLTDVEFERIVKDTEFLERIAIFDAEIQSNIVMGLMELSTSSNESIRLKAVIKLGELYYKKKFHTNKDMNPDDDDNDNLDSIPDRIILTGGDDDTES